MGPYLDRMSGTEDIAPVAAEAFAVVEDHGNQSRCGGEAGDVGQ